MISYGDLNSISDAVAQKVVWEDLRAMCDRSGEGNRAESQAIIADIHSAFDGVTLGDDGYSWEDCESLDMDWCRAETRATPVAPWRDLITDVDWQPFPGIGGFSFINLEGFRYYLPPTMIRLVRGDDSEWYDGHLLGVIERFSNSEQISLWTQQQLRCIARFVAFMAREFDELERFSTMFNPWAEAFHHRWCMYFCK